MENNTLNQETLIQDIKKLELNTKTVRDRLRNLQNEMIVEENKKNFHEVKVAELWQSIQFYIELTLELQKRLQKASNIYSQFDTAVQCYERVFKAYKEEYLTLVPNEEMANMGTYSFKKVGLPDIFTKGYKVLDTDNLATKCLSKNMHLQIENCQQQIYFNWQHIDEMIQDMKERANDLLIQIGN